MNGIELESRNRGNQMCKQGKRNGRLSTLTARIIQNPDSAPLKLDDNHSYIISSVTQSISSPVLVLFSSL